MSTRIYVATHKRDDHLLLLKDNSIYIPIHCGKDIFKDSKDTKGYLPELGDNTGDNISKKNLNYCELTALYWIWKNDDSKPNDIVGLNHYRRYFRSSLKEDLINEEEITKLLNEYNFIVNGCGYDGHTQDEEDPQNSIYKNYCGAHYKADIDRALTGTKILFPDIYDKMNYEIKNHGAMCLCNMFITKKKYLDEYCNYLFSVLGYVESQIDLTSEEYQGYNGRVFGFLGERLLRPWLVTTNHTAIQANDLNWEKYSGYIWE